MPYANDDSGMDSASGTASPARGNAQQRGSERLLENLGRREFSDEQLKRLITLHQIDGVELGNWFPKGTPRPDTIQGLVRVKPDQLGNYLQHLVEADDFRIGGIRTFPWGIPVIDEFLIEFEAVPGMR